MNEKKSMDKALVILEGVSKVYRMGEVDVTALNGVSIEIHEGEFIAIIGQSGSGKSTMMNIVGCLDWPTRGKVFLRSRDITTMSESELAVQRGKTIGFIFQQYNLIPSMSAYENVLLPLELQEMDDSLARERAKKVLSQVGLTDKMHHLPTQLSGGQQQRVSIARSLASDPDIILADEPTGALDSNTGLDVLRLLQELWKDKGKTIIMVTHDLNLAQYASRHIELKDGAVVKDYHNKDMRLFTKGDKK